MMSENNKSYLLKFLFDKKQINLEELEDKARNVLRDYCQNIELKVDTRCSASLQLTIKGTLEIIDSCHKEINKVLLNQNEPQLKGIRLVDEVGDYIRQQAYPILAEIEQSFRAFINQAFLEASGFDWWDTLLPAKVSDKSKPILSSCQEKGIFITPLECTQFSDSIAIITENMSVWSKSKTLCVSDLMELLSGCESIDGVEKKLEEKLKGFSYWDRIFSRYFHDRKQWELIKKDIQAVIEIRHTVMHHRPINLDVIEDLRKKKEEILGLISSAKSELSEQEQDEAQEDIKSIQDRKASEYVESLLSPEMTSIFEKLLEYRIQPSGIKIAESFCDKWLKQKAAEPQNDKWL